jgi:hypothetical protein
MISDKYFKYQSSHMDNIGVPKQKEYLSVCIKPLWPQLSIYNDGSS